MSPRRFATALAIACGVVLVHAPAGASPTYPSSTKDHLQLNQAPACTLCHATNAGGSNTVDKPVGVALVARGLSGGSDVAKLTAALDKLEADRVDSDGDGVLDIDELHAGTDPNVANAAGAAPIEPIRYGFGCASVAHDTWTSLLALLVVGAWCRRRMKIREVDLVEVAPMQHGFCCHD